MSDDFDVAIDPNRVRLNKFLADRGVCSRRDADLWIESGRVTVNGELADLGDYIDDHDHVRVDGELLAAHKKPKRVYIALHKPVGIECTSDQRIDGNIIDFVGHQERVFPIGRLDKDSDGLILLTNDGDIVNKILRAEHHHEKEYWVSVDRKIGDDILRGMAQGVRIMGRTTRPCKTYKMAAQTFGIILTEGMNRQIRRMAEVFGYKVTKLTRVRIMNIGLGHLKLGRWRNLTDVELALLQASTARRPAVSDASRSITGAATTRTRRAPSGDRKPAFKASADKSAHARRAKFGDRRSAGVISAPRNADRPFVKEGSVKPGSKPRLGSKIAKIATSSATKPARGAFRSEANKARTDKPRINKLGGDRFAPRADRADQFETKTAKPRANVLRDGKTKPAGKSMDRERSRPASKATATDRRAPSTRSASTRTPSTRPASTRPASTRSAPTRPASTARSAKPSMRAAAKSSTKTNTVTNNRPSSASARLLDEWQ